MTQNPITGYLEIPEGPQASISPTNYKEIKGGLIFTDTPPSGGNLIRGVNIAPVRASGWTAFSGTVTDSPAAVYSDYRELHTNGNAEPLGVGSFMFADDGASIANMVAGQFICEADAGSTITTASGAPAVGVFPVWAKVVLSGETFDSGAVAAAIFLSFQANVTNVVAEDTSLINGEVASGGIRSVIRLRHSAANLATNFLEIDSEVAPVGNGATGFNDPNAGSCDKNLKVLIGSTVYMIPLYQAS